MAIKYVVDTHALIWFLENNPRLGKSVSAVLSDPVSDLILPVTALAEACWLVERGKSSVPSVIALLAAVDADTRVTVSALTAEIVRETITLHAISEIHDRQIVATTLLIGRDGHRVALLTKDANIVASKLVDVVW